MFRNNDVIAMANQLKQYRWMKEIFHEINSLEVALFSDLANNAVSS
jgi:hypothetical protein